MRIQETPSTVAIAKKMEYETIEIDEFLRKLDCKFIQFFPNSGIFWYRFMVRRANTVAYEWQALTSCRGGETTHNVASRVTVFLS